MRRKSSAICAAMQAEGRFGMSGDKLIEIAEEKKRADEARAGEKRKREEEKAEKREILQKAKEENAREAEMRRRIREGEPVKIRLKVVRARNHISSAALISVE